MTEWITVVCAAASIALLCPPTRLAARVDATAPADRPIDDLDAGWMRRWRWVCALLAGAAAAVFVSGVVGLVAGVAAAVSTWVFIGRTEPASAGGGGRARPPHHPARRRRRALQRELPALVHLLAAALRSGTAVPQAVTLVCDACPGPAADAVSAVGHRLELGIEPAAAWGGLLSDPQLALLARTMVRADRSGASVSGEVSRLADDLTRRARTEVEERARAVGVKAAVPLGLCLLPSFILLGIVPLVVSLLQSLTL
jgi:Flp pilus assembly protein TadB